MAISCRVRVILDRAGNDRTFVHFRNAPKANSPDQSALRSSSGSLATLTAMRRGAGHRSISALTCAKLGALCCTGGRLRNPTPSVPQSATTSCVTRPRTSARGLFRASRCLGNLQFAL